MNPGKIKKFLDEHNQPAFRLGQIKKAVYNDGVSSFSEVTTLPKDLREEMDKSFKILSFETEKILSGIDKKSFKALLALQDGNFVETVLISPKGKDWSACVSCQVGCNLACRFCATGAMGCKRDLSAEEITDQVLFWRNYLLKNKIPGRVADIVFMGMGEPFLNWENVSESLTILTDPDFFGFGSRSVSVSTSGISEGIEKMAGEFPQMNLAISLHFADNAKRSEFMPVNRKYGLDSLKKSLENYFRRANRKVFLEYLMLAGVNDGESDAAVLSEYINSFRKKHLLHVNLTPYNAASADFKPSSREKISEFKNYLLKRGIRVTVRKSLGREIKAACGQLAP